MTTMTTARAQLAVNRTIDYSLLSAPELIDVIDAENAFDEELPAAEDTGNFAHHLEQIEQEHQDYYQHQGDEQEGAAWTWTELGLGEFS